MVRRKDKDSILLSEECVSISVTGADKSVQLLSESEVRKIMSAEVTRNMDYALRIKHIQTSIEKALELEDELNEIAKTRANELLLDHRRVREASEGKGVRYSVEPCLPADIIGIYVLIPDKDL
jgi:hypothetical protein